MEQGAVRIKSLDGWRAISIIMVVIGHLINYRYGPAERHAASLAEYFAGMGVSIFFVISGFLITSLSLKEEADTHSFSAFQFYTRRVFRIIPAYAVFLLGAALLSATGVIVQQFEGLERAAAFMCNLPGRSCGWFVGHSWSLAYEQQFYLLFPLAFALSISARRKWAILIHLGVVAASLLALVLPRDMQDVLQFISRFSSITGGVLLGCYAHRIERFVSDRRFVLAAVLVVASSIVLVGANALQLRFEVRFAIETMILPPALGWLILCSLSASGWVERSLNNAPMRYIGAVSYSLYLWQQIFTGPATTYANTAWLPWVLMLPAAVLSYELVEKPFIRIGRRIAGMRTKTGLPARVHH